MIIYKQYNQQQLDNQYNNRLHVSDFATYLERWDTSSESTRAKYAYIQDLKYGDHPRECLDIFPCNKPNAKVLVFIHGGYWQLFDKMKFHFIAEAFLPHNITTVLINYPLAPAATMDDIVASCQKAMLWLQLNLATYSISTNEMYLVGHSAGAHLAAMIMCKEPNEFNKTIKGICLLSGLFNLIPILLSNRNEILQMDKEIAVRNSPIKFLPEQICPMLIATGANETEEFKNQSRELYNYCKNKAASLELLELPGLNHFSILDALTDKNALLHKTLIKLMTK